MNESSSICPAAHHSALFLIQAGISFEPEPEPCVGGGIFRTSSLIKYWMPWTKEPSSICPAAHHSALFLIQLGIDVFSGIDGVEVEEPGPISITA